MPSLAVAKAAAPALFFLYPALKAGLWIIQHSINVKKSNKSARLLSPSALSSIMQNLLKQESKPIV